MAKLGEIVNRVRSKNAGPFWLTIDIFCETDAILKTVTKNLPTERVAKMYGQSTNLVKRFEIPELNVLKLSMPRPVIQGSREDRDMHAAQYGWLLVELEIELES